MIKPLFVYVEWSESGEFKEKSLHDFADFERLALHTANLCADRDEGYYKTKIVVMFSDGTTYACRLDLNASEKSFTRHCNDLISYYHAKEKPISYNYYTKSVAFLETVNFSTN